MMVKLIRAFVFVELLVASPARADFRLQPGTQTAMPAAAEQGPTAETVESSPRLRLALTLSRVASGFGQGVPLGFAVRQIVPPGVRVWFGRGVDRTEPVDWTGGQAWNRVLAAAVAPLGLHVTVASAGVVISR